MMNRATRLPLLQYGCHHFCNHKNGNFMLLCTRSRECKNEMEQGKGMTRDEAYRQLQNLDFKAAAKILFTDQPKQKKFGLDFHLVQLFFACLPSLAVYLVAQYARSEMKRMDAELNRKKKQAEEEEKKIEEEKISIQERTENELVMVKGRLDVLEVTLKEIADQTKKIVQSIPLRNNTASSEDGGSRKPTGSDDVRDKAASSSSSSSEGDGEARCIPHGNPKFHDVTSGGHDLKGSNSNGSIGTSDEPKHGGLRGVARRWAGYFRDR